MGQESHAQEVGKILQLPPPQEVETLDSENPEVRGSSIGIRLSAMTFLGLHP